MTGEPLGARGAPVKVDVTMNVYEKPTFLQKLLGKSASAHAQVISLYVCCLECSARVKSDPNTYIVKVLMERAASVK